MKKWQEERNYRRIYNEAGEAIANIITVDGVDVEVAEDVYLAYSQADRRERYVREEQFPGNSSHWNRWRRMICFRTMSARKQPQARRKKHWNGSRHRALRNERRCCCWPCCL